MCLGLLIIACKLQRESIYYFKMYSNGFSLIEGKWCHLILLYIYIFLYVNDTAVIKGNHASKGLSEQFKTVKVLKTGAYGAYVC